MGKGLAIITIESVFPPDPMGRLRYEFAKELADRGNRLIVIVPFPSKRFSSHNKAGNKKFLPKLFDWEKIENVFVLRTLPRKKLGNTFLSKITEHLLMPISLSISALIYAKDSVIMHCSSPPILSAFFACIVSSIKRCPLALRIHDVHPDALVKMGLIRSKIVISLLEMIEKVIYLHANKITVISSAYKSHIISRGICPDKIEIIPNWYSPSFPILKNDSKSLIPEVIAKIQRKKLFTYAGSLYWAQDLETVIDAANLLRKEKEIFFLIVGDGPKKQELKRRAKKMNLNNLIFLPIQPRKTYFKIVLASRACIVTLNKDYTSPTLPSKVPELMGLGKPLIVNAPKDSEVVRVVSKASCGLIVEPGDPESFARAVLMLSRNEDLAKKLGSNGKLFAEKNFSPSVCIDRYEKIFYSLKRTKKFKVYAK